MSRPVSLTVCAWALLLAASGIAWSQECTRCGWTPPEHTQSLFISTIDELESSLSAAQPNTTMYLRSGTYRLRRMLDLRVPGLALRGLSGDPNRVKLRGEGLTENSVGVALSVSAPDVVISDLTVGHVGFHGVQVRGEKKADGLVLHNVQVLDTGQQLVKGSADREGRGPNGGLVSCSMFSYTTHAPGNYTNAVDILGGAGWVVRKCLFERIRGKPEEAFVCGPTVLFWHGSRDTLVEENRLEDCFRGIALGLQRPKASHPYTHDHDGGIIRRNILVNLDPWADEGIEVNAAANVLVEDNTVRVEGRLPWSISVRFPESSARVVGNRLARPVVARDGARLEEAKNSYVGPQGQLLGLLMKVLRLVGFLLLGALLALIPRRHGLNGVRIFALALGVSISLQAGIILKKRIPNPLQIATVTAAIWSGWWIVSVFRHGSITPNPLRASRAAGPRKPPTAGAHRHRANPRPVLPRLLSMLPLGAFFRTGPNAAGPTLTQALSWLETAPRGLVWMLVLVGSIAISVLTSLLIHLL